MRWYTAKNTEIDMKLGEKVEVEWQDTMQAVDYWPRISTPTFHLEKNTTHSL